MNSLYQQLNQPSNSNFKQFVKLFKNSNNPQQMLNQLIQNNPQMQGIYTLLQNSNKNPKELFYEIAKQKGIDPNTILQMFQDD